MTAQAAGAGALSGHGEHWHGINWAMCYREVRRLQSRIVKATQEGSWNKVKALQWLLTHSFSGKALAVRRVTENQGRKTPGIDKEIWSTPSAKYCAISRLKRRGYQPQPLRRIYIPKQKDKTRKRPLDIPCLIDRAMQALCLLALEPASETQADSHSYGFRRERSTADAIAHCHTLLAKSDSPQWVLEGDIRSCFSEISHDWLIAHVPMDKAILLKWLKAGYIENRRQFPTETGTAQGGLISPALANWALDGLQGRLAQSVGRRFYRDKKRINPKVNLVRYADDFIITGHSKEYLEQAVQPIVSAFLSERGLTLSPEKTRTTHITEGFDFLGQNIRRYKNKVLTKPSEKNGKAFLEKIRTTIKQNKMSSQQALIQLLNPIIVGWMNYHRHAAAKKTFSQADSEIRCALWRWCSRRHPNKGKRWIKQRYFHRVRSRNWEFRADTGKLLPSGKPEGIALCKTSDVAIRRHIKIKAEANPFDPEWESYFQKRSGWKMLDTYNGKRQLIRRWLDQQGLCPICEQRITKETGWHTHHIIRRVEGGSDAITNLILVHPTCHNQIHSQGLTVTKPAPNGALKGLSGVR